MACPFLKSAALALFLFISAAHAEPYASLKVVPPLPADGDLKVFAQGAEALDVATGTVLFAKNPDQILYPASATKILTALIVIEAGHLDQLVTTAPEDTRAEPSKLDLKPGEQHTRLELLYGLLLHSANDVALELARDNAGSVADFADKMNTVAARLGATSSHFTNPNGLPDKHHFTTAHDLALIARAAMQQPVFRRVVGTDRYWWKGEKGVMELINHNRMLTRFPGCTGIKTGYTVAAQQVLVSSAAWGGHEVISVVLHTNKPGIWDDSRLLLTYGLTRLLSAPAK
jgi:D-alanyl-D-alanine carboxypeptidase (penicillin-binding protein 5/6)